MAKEKRERKGFMSDWSSADKHTFVAACISAVTYYIVAALLWHPTLSVHSPESLVYFGIGILVFLGIEALAEAADVTYETFPGAGVPLIVLGIAVLTMLIGWLTGAPLFRNQSLAAIPNIKTGDFNKEIAESEEVSDIALMDTETALMFAERALGELSDLVSVYDVDSDYCTTICYQGKPMKVVPLKYDGFTKWAGHYQVGIPGYVMIDPVNPSAQYAASPKPIMYSASAYFAQDLSRHMWFHGPVNVYGKTFFEIDEEGNPYWVTPIYTAKVGLYGGRVVESVAIMDASTGVCVDYPMGEVPEWVDIVVDGDTVSKYYNWYGELRNGFWNSLFAQNGCFKTTDDFGYKIIGNDVYIYTGITSCNNSASATGFLLANSRTGEMTFMSITGAEEHSAMSAAEGEVSDYGWKASFPSIINVNGEPVYLMVLKDENNIVKRYAMVNIKSYNIVAIDSTQKKVLAKYNALINGEDVSEIATTSIADEVEIPDTAVETTLVVKDIQYIVNGGNTTVYITSNDNKVYRSQFEEGYILIHTGDTVTLTVVDGDPIGTAYAIK